MIEDSCWDEVWDCIILTIPKNTSHKVWKEFGDINFPVFFTEGDWE